MFIVSLSYKKDISEVEKFIEAHRPGINEGTKYILSKTRKKSDWKNSIFPQFGVASRYVFFNKASSLKC